MAWDLRVLLSSDADVTATDPAVRDQVGDDPLGGVDRDGEADALAAEDDRRVDANDFAGRGDERAAGVAGVKRGVGLNEVLHQPAGPRAVPGRAR